MTDAIARADLALRFCFNTAADVMVLVPPPAWHRQLFDCHGFKVLFSINVDGGKESNLA